ncbi:acyl-CoA dehydrogenase family protein [Gammaproteobacteria bacterium]|nr:acyl-CoA dehydrogenase family protein [Gammaproteobacteria bacterium]
MSSEKLMILAAIDKFLEKEVRPVVKEFELADKYPHDIVAKMRELGLFGATISEEYGGLGLSAEIYAQIVEHVSKVWMSVSGIFNSHLIMCSAVEKFGTSQMKEKFLPLMAAGELRGGIALTEPDCGTDLQAIRMRADRQEDSYVLNGTKQWITNSVEGNVLAVLVKTDLNANPRHKGMSLLIVEKNMGYKATKLSKLGYRGIDTGEVQFEDIRVPLENLVGLDEGKGLQQILSGLALGRINVAARGVGVASAALDASLSYSQERETFGQPINQHQAIQIKLADMATRVEASRLLTAKAAQVYDSGERCDLEAGMAKLCATEAAMENASEALRIHGAYGYSPDNEVERLYRDAPLLVVGEGTNELQRIIIARQLIEKGQF